VSKTPRELPAAAKEVLRGVVAGVAKLNQQRSEHAKQLEEARRPPPLPRRKDEFRPRTIEGHLRDAHTAKADLSSLRRNMERLSLMGMGPYDPVAMKNVDDALAEIERRLDQVQEDARDVTKWRTARTPARRGRPRGVPNDTYILAANGINDLIEMEIPRSDAVHAMVDCLEPTEPKITGRALSRWMHRYNLSFGKDFDSAMKVLVEELE